MKYVVRKAFFNYEKEEKYLNEMAAKGMALTDYSWCRYVFNDCQRGEYIYRIELLDHYANHPESIAYIKFMEETGVECVATYNRWAYFRRKAVDGPFDIYTDIKSKIRHYKKINVLWKTLAAIEFSAGIVNIVTAAIAWVRGGDGSMNLGIGLPLLALGFVFVFAALPSGRKIKNLKKEQAIRE